MGIFDSLADKYSTYLVSLPTTELRQLVSHHQIASLTKDEEAIVEEALEGAKRGGRITMRRVYETLHSLRNKGQISPNDERALLAVFEERLTAKERG